MSPKSVLDTTIDHLLEQTLNILEWRETKVLSHVVAPPILQDTVSKWERLSRVTIKATQRSSRSVSFAFNPQVQSTISRHDMSPEEIVACWWTSVEHEANTTKATSLVKFTRQQGRSFIKRTINRTLDRALSLAHELYHEDSDVEKLFTDKKAMSSKHLREWTKHCKARRGLESYFVDHPSFADLVREHRQIVLSSFKGELSTTSERSSLPSRIFARMNGVADEQLVRMQSELPV
jgi:hypothetical protein